MVFLSSCNVYILIKIQYGDRKKKWKVLPGKRCITVRAAVVGYAHEFAHAQFKRAHTNNDPACIFIRKLGWVSLCSFAILIATILKK